MRILFVAPHPFMANRGTPLAEKRLLGVLAEAGHHVDVLTYPQGEDIHEANIRLIRIGRIPFVAHVPIGFSLRKVLQDIPLFLSFARVIRQRDYDAVHCVEEAAIMGTILTRGSSTPLIYDMDSLLSEELSSSLPFLPGIAKRLCRRVEHWVIANSHAVIAACPALAEYARSRFPRNHVAYTMDLPPDHADDLSAPPETTGMNRPIFLYAGSLAKYQGVDLMLAAFHNGIVRQGHPGTAAIVGGTAAEQKRMRRLARSLGLDERVRILGSRPVAQIPSWLASADILVSPRRRGINTPMKLYAYLHGGKPIVATRITSHTQILDESDAMLADPTVESLADTFGRLARSPQLRDALGRKAARKYRAIAARHCAKAYRQTILSLYGARP